MTLKLRFPVGSLTGVQEVSALVSGHGRLQAVGMTNRQLKTMLIYEGLFYAMSSVAAAFILSLAVGPLAGKMLGSMFWFFEYRFTILPVLLTIPVFLLLGWLIPCMMYDNAAKCSVVEQLRDAQ